ncbi:nucleoside transporter-domain-containing protein [Butyriboletus roseoflavus]|nr:nucleoside transporter-domain-containing protein [Butyriboletus roseoflavus]
MIDSSAKYHAIPPSEDEAYHSDVHEAGVTSASEDDYYSTREWSSAAARTKWTYFLLGCAILLPWNALINATSFFLSRLAGSPLYPTFSSYLSSVYTLTNLACQFYSTVTSKQSSPSRRTFASIIAMILLVTSLCLSTFIRGTPSTFFSFALFNGAAVAVTSAYLCTAVFAGAALLGASFLQTVLSGQAAVAVAVSAVQVASSMISLWGSPLKPVSMEAITTDSRDKHPEEIAARIFFAVSTVFLGITLAAYTWLTKQSFYKSVTGSLERHREVGDIDELTGLVADGCRNPLTDANSRVYQVFKQNMIFMFSIAYVFAVTLAVYPATTVRVQPVNPGIHPSLFTAIHFLIFNIGDLVGRYSCTFPRLLVWSAKKILAMSLLRTLFIPLILLCNVHRPTITTPVSPIISSDISFMIILLTMGYTNGYVSTLATLAVSSLEHNSRLKGRREDVDVAATLSGFSVTVGLASGALSSFGVQAMK